MIKKYISLLWILISITCISSFSSCSCSRPDESLARSIDRYAKDDQIDKLECDKIQAIIEKNPDYKNFRDLASNRELLQKYVDSVVGDKNVKIECWEAPLKWDSIHFYIETSSSMGGYMNGGTQFQDVTCLLVSQLNSDYQKIHFKTNTVKQIIRSYPNIDTYLASLRDSRFEFGDSSPLDSIFKIIIRRTGNNDINFFATDGIMSGTNEQVNQDPEFNKKNRMTMRGTINNIFSKHRNDYSVSIYAFNSKFRSRSSRGFYYYNYQNGRINRSFENRPYYIFVFGDKRLMKEINKQLQKYQDFCPKEELHFGLKTAHSNEGILFKSYLNSREKRRCLIKNKEIRCNDEPTDSNPVKFAIGFNLDHLPDYAKSGTYLDTNILIKCSNEVRIRSKAPKIYKISDELIEKLSNRERANILRNGCTHYIELEIENLYSQADVMTVVIHKVTDNWYETWSVEDDLDIANNHSKQEKTFNFKYLIKGLQDAFDEQDNYVKTTFSIKK